ncbi:cobalamin B12-binding domain-containing protein [Thalassococcus sp. BH17M4-6]|uniref:cobalamin B12-binding domain-containing protein n=1 Tax=Thalassococcus sp. BH17M4-6 TaxID=3413148 RepID=UPI003BE60E41
MTDQPTSTERHQSVVDGDAGQSLPEALLFDLAKEVISHLTDWSRRPTVARIDPVRLRVVPNIDVLCRALVGRDADAPRRIILDAHENGASHEEICLGYIAPAAYRLGEMWEEDEVTFADMAVATGRLLVLLRTLRELVTPAPQRGARCALIATVPDETHSIGATMAADLLRDRGWDIDLRLGKTESELVDLLRRGGYPIIGLSAATPERVRGVARTVVELRLMAPNVLILISGGLAAIDRHIADRVGADAAAHGMENALEEMERLYAMLPASVAP